MQKENLSQVSMSVRRATTCACVVCLSGDERHSRVKQKHKIECLMKDRAVFTEAAGFGPRDALKRVMSTVKSEAEKNAYMQGARLDAILGSCLASLPSVRSGVRCYLAFADAMGHKGGMYLPPRLDMLLTWSTLFRSVGTFSNYMGHVKTSCLLIGVSTDVFKEPAVKRSKDAIRKRNIAAQREKMWIQMALLGRVMSWCDQQGTSLAKTLALLFLTAYVFLLRLPSEALPIAVGNVGGPACLFLEGSELVLRLAKRSLVSVPV